MVIQFGHQILNGENPRLFINSNKIMRDFVNIKDVIQANIKSCTPKQSGVYNVGTGTPRSFVDIVEILQKELTTNLKPEFIPNPYKNYQMHTQADITCHPNLMARFGMGGKNTWKVIQLQFLNIAN